jgi:hypothetical protein
MPDDSLTRTIRAHKMGSQHIITPRLNMWLMQNPNFDVDEAVADIIRDLLVKKQRNRSGSFSSSAAGSCLRRQIYAYLGIATGEVNGPQLQQIFNDGTWRHLRWQATLLQAGIIDSVEDMLDWPAMRSMGSMDGRGVVPDDHPHAPWRGLEFGFELKGMNSFAFQPASRKPWPKDNHHQQIDRYFLSGGFDLFVVIYEDKNTQEWKEWVIEPDPDRMAAQRAELVVLNSHVDQQTIPPQLVECAKQLKTGEFSKCPYGGKGGVCVSRDSW